MCNTLVAHQVMIEAQDFAPDRTIAGSIHYWSSI